MEHLPGGTFSLESNLNEPNGKLPGEKKRRYVLELLGVHNELYRALGQTGRLLKAACAVLPSCRHSAYAADVSLHANRFQA
jgi:hypothetical protein